MSNAKCNWQTTTYTTNSASNGLSNPNQSDMICEYNSNSKVVWPTDEPKCAKYNLQPLQGVYKSSLTNFQEISRTHLTNFQ